MNLQSRAQVFLIAGAFLSVGWAAAASAQETCTPRHEGVKTLEEGYITSAVTILSPISFVDGKGEISGIDGEILTEIARMECLKVKPVTVDSSAAVQSVISKRTDTTIGGWFRTEARAKVVNLSEPIWLAQMGVWSREGIDTIAALEDKRVGAVQGSLWNNDVKAVFGEKLKLYPNGVAMQQDLMAGRIDAAFESIEAGNAAKRAGTLEGIQVKPIKPDDRVDASKNPGQINFPVSKDNPSLLAAFDANIKVLHENGRIAEILVKYGMDASAADTGAPRLLK